MVRELRKRKAEEPAAPTPAPAKKTKAPSKPKAKAETVAKPEPATKTEPKDEAKTTAKTTAKANDKADGPLTTGDKIDPAGFGGETQMHDGTPTTVAELLKESTTGIVLFTYPKASTPGCTQQACLFRNAHDGLKKRGLAIYGLSNDPLKANTGFKDKHGLTYPLLCDPKRTLIEAIGMKNEKGTTARGVVIINKNGEVLLVRKGGPAGTLEAAEKVAEDLEEVE